jgi:hypothetical protein
MLLGADAHRHVIALPDVAEPERNLEARWDIRDLLQLGRDLGLHLCDIAGEARKSSPCSGVFRVRAISYAAGASTRPSADNTPALNGTSIRLMRSFLARLQT